MPTTHVVSGSESELQDIANSLWKSRKVVVITGAGISTNSGIPDFRSEGGLYSLIQQQFDAAAAAEAGNSGIDDSDECDRSSDISNERPVKRRRLSQDAIEVKPRGTRDGDSIEVAVIEEEIVAEIECAGDPDTSGVSEEDASKRADTAPSLTIQVAGSHDDAVMLDNGLRIAPDPSDEPPGSLHSNPATPLKITGHIDELSTFTPLPSPFLSRPTAQIAASNEQDGNPQLESSPPSLTHDNSRFPSDSDQSFPHTVTSSPLSSPPTFLYDPYQQSSRRATTSPSPSSPRNNSSPSESSSSSTPVLNSQSSFASFAGRNSLPTNMKGKDLFQASIWSCPKQTAVFYTFITSLRQKAREAEPTSTHRFLSILRDKRKLVRCYTQNIDLLEERVGLSTSLELGPGSRYRFSARSGRSSGGARGSLKETELSNLSQVEVAENNNDTPSGTQGEGDSQSTVVVIDGDAKEQPSSQSEISLSQASTATAKPPPNRGVECVCVHGSLAQLRCFVCRRTASWDEESRESDTLAGRQPKCPHCEKATADREERGKRALGVGKLRPNIVLYGEEHPQEHLIEQVVRHDLSLGPDMLLILGTSLRVHGMKTLVREFAKTVHDRGGKVVFVNYTKPPDSVWADFIDYWVQWDCDQWVSDIEKRKPALWLPLGTVLPEDEKAKKAPKAPRKSNNVGEGSKTAKEDSVGSKARRALAAGTAKRGRPRKEASSITVSATQEEGEIVVSGLEIPVAGSAPLETQQGEQPLPSDSVQGSADVDMLQVNTEGGRRKALEIFSLTETGRRRAEEIFGLDVWHNPGTLQSGSAEVVVVAAKETVEVGAPEKPVVEPEEAVVANTSPSPDSPPGQVSSRLPTQIPNHRPPSRGKQLQERPDGPSSLFSPTGSRSAKSSPAAPQNDRQSAGLFPDAKDASYSSLFVTASRFAQSPYGSSFASFSQRHDALPEQPQFAVGEVSPHPLPSSSAKKTAQPKAPKEPKLMNDAKRPAAVRDDKRNAAWLTWKIAQDLRRITGREPLTPATSSPTMPPRARKSNKARKSAPAALGSPDPEPTLVRAQKGFVTTIDAASSNSYQQTQHEQTAQESQQQLQTADNDGDTEMHNSQDPSSGPADAPPAAPSDISPLGLREPESSISALVKSRKRKRQSWKLVAGVETLVDHDAEEAEEPTIAENAKRAPNQRRKGPQKVTSEHSAAATDAPDLAEEPKGNLPDQSRARSQEGVIASDHTPMLEPPKRIPQVIRLPPGETMKKRMTLPAAFPYEPDLGRTAAFMFGSPFDNGFSSTDALIAKLSNELAGPPNPQGHADMDNTTPGTGFRETDRLIALASRPTSPGFRMNPEFQLPPLRQQSQPQPAARNASTQGQVGNPRGTRLYSPTKPDGSVAGRLQPLEPMVMTPGPTVEIAPSVGSPSPRAPSGGPRSPYHRRSPYWNTMPHISFGEPYPHMNSLPLGQGNSDDEGDFLPANRNPHVPISSFEQPLSHNALGIAGNNSNNAGTNSMEAYMNSIMAATVDASQTMTANEGGGTNAQNTTNATPVAMQQGPNAPGQNATSQPYQQVFDYTGDPLLRHLQFPPMWWEQSYNRSHFALRTPPPGSVPPPPGSDGYGRYHLDGSPVRGVADPSSPDEQLRREQEAAVMLSMMGRGGPTQAMVPTLPPQHGHPQQHGAVQRGSTHGALAQYAQAQQRARRQQQEMHELAAAQQGVTDAAAMPPPGSNNGFIQGQGQAGFPGHTAPQYTH
ncbi:hypothetical protein V8F20_001840 [Naviculisporaceae sp. PSN 640]